MKFLDFSPIQNGEEASYWKSKVKNALMWGGVIIIAVTLLGLYQGMAEVGIFAILKTLIVGTFSLSAWIFGYNFVRPGGTLAKYSKNARKAEAKAESARKKDSAFADEIEQAHGYRPAANLASNAFGQDIKGGFWNLMWIFSFMFYAIAGYVVGLIMLPTKIYHLVKFTQENRTIIEEN